MHIKNIPANAFSEAKKLMDTAEPLFVEDRITAEETEAGITHSKDATANSNVSESTATVTGNVRGRDAGCMLY